MTNTHKAREFKEWAERVDARLYSRAARLLGPRNEADIRDVIQETLLRIWQVYRDGQLAELDEGFEGFAYTVLRRIVIDRARSAAAARRAIQRCLARAAQATQAAGVDLDEVKDTLDTLYAELTQSEQRYIDYCRRNPEVLDGKTGAEQARDLGRSPAAQRRLVFRIRCKAKAERLPIRTKRWRKKLIFGLSDGIALTLDGAGIRIEMPRALSSPYKRKAHLQTLERALCNYLSGALWYGFHGAPAPDTPLARVLLQIVCAAVSQARTIGHQGLLCQSLVLQAAVLADMGQLEKEDGILGEINSLLRTDLPLTREQANTLRQASRELRQQAR